MPPLSHDPIYRSESEADAIPSFFVYLSPTAPYIHPFIPSSSSSIPLTTFFPPSPRIELDDDHHPDNPLDLPYDLASPSSPFDIDHDSEPDDLLLTPRPTLLDSPRIQSSPSPSSRSDAVSSDVITTSKSLHRSQTSTTTHCPPSPARRFMFSRAATMPKAAPSAKAPKADQPEKKAKRAKKDPNAPKRYVELLYPSNLSIPCFLKRESVANLVSPLPISPSLL
jgi:hypothetical protein